MWEGDRADMRAVRSRNTRDDRLGMLDALRFLAAMSVVAFHFTARESPAWGGPVPDELAGFGSWAAYGRLGVPLFFTISGFVMLMSAWGRDVPGFVASRIGRLFPAYWVAVAMSVPLVLYIWPENPEYLGHEITASGALLNASMLHFAFAVPSVDGPYWTLWYEAKFYFLIAIFMLIGITRRRVLAFTALWPIAGGVSAGTGSDLLTALLMPDYAPFFAGGMLLYLVYRDGHDLGTWLLIALQGLIALDFAMNLYPDALAVETTWVPSKPAIAVATSLCFGLVALVTLTPVARRNARWMGVAGALTYPVYLVHENLGWFVIAQVHDGLGPWGAVCTATVVVLVVGVALHHLVEKPLGPRLRRAVLHTFTRGTDVAPGAAGRPVLRASDGQAAATRSLVLSGVPTTRRHESALEVSRALRPPLRDVSR